MSTKIYNGYRLPKMQIEELLAFCKKLQVRAKVERNRLIAERFGENYRELFIDLLGRVGVVKRTGQRDPLIDYSFEVVFIPSGDFFLAITYTDQEPFTKLWEVTPGVEEYGYWDNVDPLEGVPDDEWEVRGIVWQKALGGDGYAPPAQCGFTFTVLDYDLPWPDDISAKHGGDEEGD